MLYSPVFRRYMPQPVEMTWGDCPHVSSIDASTDVDVLQCAAAFTTVTGAVRSAFAHNGLRGPFQGLGPTILRNTPANSIYLGSFEVLKKEFAKYKGCE